MDYPRWMLVVRAYLVMFGSFVLIALFGVLLPVTVSLPVQAESRQLTACGHQDYPPFNWHDDDGVKGVGVDVVVQVFASLGVKVKPVFVGPWKRCLESVRRGTVDIVLAAYATDERKQYAQFSKVALAEDRKLAFVWKGREFAFDSWDDLKGKRAGIQLGVSYGQRFDDFLAQYVEVTQVAERLQYFKMLQSNRIDFIATGAHIGLIHARRAGYGENIVALDQPITTGYLHIGMSKLSSSLHLMSQVDELLTALHRSGAIERLTVSHLQQYMKAVSVPVDI